MEIRLQKTADHREDEAKDHHKLEALQPASLLLVHAKQKTIDEAQEQGDAEADAQAEVVVGERLVVWRALGLRQQLGFGHELQGVNRPIIEPLEDVVDCILAQNEPNHRGENQVEEVQLPHDADRSRACKSRG